MLNRRHIRTIVVQSIYSNLVESIEAKDLKNYINKSSSSCLDLFYCMVDYLKEINLFFNNLESQKFSCPFVSSNPYFFFFTKLNAKSFKRKQIINWDLNHNYIIEIQDQIFDLNKEFLESKKNDDKSRLEFFIKCYSEIILNSNLFYEFIEDQNINWVNDFPYVNTFILKNIEKIDLQNPDSFPLPSLFDFQDELKFGQDLFINTLENFDELKLNIEGRTPNWESDRIAQIDYVILITAIAELIYFSSIPTKVTINEYIDIAKEFSTPASGKFVNGVLDNIVKDLTKQGLIVKTGRGLIT
ncbi:MAG: transcription antitermination factor NusB [Flavobacteriaceae bacterium]